MYNPTIVRIYHSWLIVSNHQDYESSLYHTVTYLDFCTSTL